MKIKAFIFDWGDTLMVDNPSNPGKMKDWPIVYAISEALNVLNSLKNDFHIFLATNAIDSDKEDILMALNRVGLDIYIDKIFSYKNLGFKKDNPIFFERIIKDTGLKRDQLIMVGDSFEKDILSANKAGIFGLWFNNKTTEDRNGKMYKTIFSLTDILDFKKSRIQ